MIKLRVEGTNKDIEEYLQYLRSRKELEILSITDPVHNRAGISQYYRSYVELKLKTDELEENVK